MKTTQKNLKFLKPTASLKRHIVVRQQKFNIIFMKAAIKILGLLMVTIFIFSACSKDDDPADNDLFVGTYNGTVAFRSTNDGESNVSSTEGSVRVVKVGNNYSFNFSNGIRTLNDIQMQKNENNMIVFSDEAIGSISVTESTLRILYNKDGRTWTADCKR